MCALQAQSSSAIASVRGAAEAGRQASGHLRIGTRRRPRPKPHLAEISYQLRAALGGILRSELPGHLYAQRRTAHPRHVSAGDPQVGGVVRVGDLARALLTTSNPARAPCRERLNHERNVKVSGSGRRNGTIYVLLRKECRRRSNGPRPEPLNLTTINFQHGDERIHIGLAHVEDPTPRTRSSPAVPSAVMPCTSFDSNVRHAAPRSRVTSPLAGWPA